MRVVPPLPLSRQRGISLLGLLFWAIIVATVAVLALRVLPTVNEYLTIQRSVEKVAASGGTTVPELRSAFDRQKEIEFAINSISGKDLEITKENEKIVIGFAYEKEIPLFGPAYLLIKYEGRSKPY